MKPDYFYHTNKTVEGSESAHTKTRQSIAFSTAEGSVRSGGQVETSCSNPPETDCGGIESQVLHLWERRAHGWKEIKAHNSM
jgi:hypothetical protein